MKESQSNRILKALLNGETVSWLWGARQSPPIAKTGNRCNEMIGIGIPISKMMIYPEDNAKYMAYFISVHNTCLVKPLKKSHAKSN